MAVLSIALQYYVHLRLNNDPGWQNIKVEIHLCNLCGCGKCFSVERRILMLWFMFMSEGYSF